MGKSIMINYDLWSQIFKNKIIKWDRILSHIQLTEIHFIQLGEMEPYISKVLLI